MYADFLGPVLECEQFVPLPEAQVVGRGLELSKKSKKGGFNEEASGLLP
jgi:hypothetical protein